MSAVTDTGASASASAGAGGPGTLPPPSRHDLAREILRQAVKLARFSARAKGCDARDGDGAYCPPFAERARSWSVPGLAWRAATKMGYVHGDQRAENRTLREAVAMVRELLDWEARLRYRRPLADMNDDPGLDAVETMVLLMAAREIIDVVGPRRDRGDAP